MFPPITKNGIFIFFTIIIKVVIVDCSPPENLIKCSTLSKNCTITNSYGAFPDRTICRAAEVKYPTTEEELISAVASATIKKTKTKIATRYSHSIPKLVCPDGENGLIISTKNLNRTLKIDVDHQTITVQSGVVLRDLIDEAAKAGLALPYTPYWWGLTIGGLLGTGAHGSTLWANGSAVHDYVVEVRIVTPAGAKDGYAKVRTLFEGDEEMNAAKVSLGVLGVISQVTLRLQKMFKRSITYITKSDTDLGDEAANFGNEHEFGDITWYPSQHKVVYRLDDRVLLPNSATGNGRLDSPGFRSTPSLMLAILRTTEENQESRGDADGKCNDAKLIASILKMGAYGLTNDGIAFLKYPVIGYHNHLQASGGCINSLPDAQITACPWDHRVKGLFFHQTAFTIELSKAKYFIKDVQYLVDLAPKSMCGVELYNGILMRYVTASTAYLGKQEASIDFDITYFRSSDPQTPRLYEDILEEVEQLAIFKYGGLPHWGKNRNIAFYEAINKYKHADKFLNVMKMYDPLQIFSNEWTDQILGIRGKVTLVKEGCALEGLCICSEDIHCAPGKGYLCRPGKIFKDARVCVHSDDKSLW